MRSRIREIIEIHIGLDPQDYREDANLIEDWGCDSLDITEVIMELEREFGILIPDEDIQYLKTPNDIYSYIERRLKKE